MSGAATPGTWPVAAPWKGVRAGPRHGPERGGRGPAASARPVGRRNLCPPSESKKRQLKARQAPRHSIRQLCDAFLTEKRLLRGQQTADDYRNRLVPIIEFAEQPKNLRQWPLAADIDRDFVVQLRKFLHERKVARNGRAAAAQHPLSASQIFNILDCARTMVNWPGGRKCSRSLSRSATPSLRIWSAIVRPRIRFGRSYFPSTYAFKSLPDGRLAAVPVVHRHGAATAAEDYTGC